VGATGRVMTVGFVVLRQTGDKSDVTVTESFNLGTMKE
jgi:hypothetical protein